jgi:hypothetical protein
MESFEAIVLSFEINYDPLFWLKIICSIVAGPIIFIFADL